MIDMHCHSLYGVDDGAQTIEDSVRMLETAASVGFTEVVLTPHYMPYGPWQAPLCTVKKNADILKRVVDKAGIPIKLHLATEIQYEYQIPAQMCGDVYKSFADSCYFMIETQRKGASSEALMRCIKKFGAMGFGTILAHPERYDFVQEDPDILSELVKKGCIIQCNYLSLSGYYGKQTEDCVCALLRKKLVHTMGSDAHQAEGYELYPESAARGVQEAGEAYWNDLMQNNPQKILYSKEKPLLPEPVPITVSSYLGRASTELGSILGH